MPQSPASPTTCLLTRIREALAWTFLGAFLASCGREQVPDLSVESVGSGAKALGSMMESGVGRGETGTAAGAPIEAGAGSAERGERAAGRVAEAEVEPSPTDPNELSAILRAVDALARRDIRAAGQEAARTLQGLAVADPEEDFEADRDGNLYLEPAHVPLLGALAEHVFDSDQATGGDLSASIPEELRETIVGEKVNGEVREGKVEEIGEWIAGLPDRDLAEIAQWELIRALYRRDGMPEALANYPASLKSRSSDLMAAGQRFSVLEAQQTNDR